MRITKTPLTNLVHKTTRMTTDMKSGPNDYWMAGVFVGGAVCLMFGVGGFLTMLVMVIILDAVEGHK